MRFDSLLIGFLMIALVVICGSAMIGDMNTKYEFAGVNVTNESFSEVYEKTDEIYSIAEQAESQTLKGEIESGTGTIDSMIKGSYTALRLVGSTFGIFNSMLWALSDTFHIPKAIVTILFAMFLITIVFALIYMLFRYVSN